MEDGNIRLIPRHPCLPARNRLSEFLRSFYVNATLVIHQSDARLPILLKFPRTLISYVKMLQRTILRASRQASRTPAVAPLRQPLVSTRVATSPAVRWYSDVQAAKEGEAAEKKEEAPAANDEVAKYKADMEKKDKEIVDLKV